MLKSKKVGEPYLPGILKINPETFLRILIFHQFSDLLFFNDTERYTSWYESCLSKYSFLWARTFRIPFPNNFNLFDLIMLRRPFYSESRIQRGSQLSDAIPIPRKCGRYSHQAGNHDKFTYFLGTYSKNDNLLLFLSSRKY